MEEVSTRAVVLGTGIFVTILIVTLVVASLNQIKDIMGLTKQANTSIHSAFGNTYANLYSKYGGKRLNGMELVNLIKRFEDDPVSGVYVAYPNDNIIREEAEFNNMRESEYLKEIMRYDEIIYGVRYAYDQEYVVIVEENNGDIYIKFE